MLKTNIANKTFKILLILNSILLPIKLISVDAPQVEIATQTQEINTPEMTAKITAPLQTQTTPDTKTSQEENNKKLENNQDDNLFLNFENASLSSVVSYLGELKKINIIPIKELDGLNVSLSTFRPFNLERAWNILLTLLELNRFTMINVDNVYRIVPKEKSKQEPLPSFSSATGTTPQDLPGSDLVVRYLYFLRNIKVEIVKGFLDTMLDNPVEPIKNLDAFIVTDKCLNIKAAMKIIEELDQGGLREAIKILPLIHADADDVAKKFNDEILGKDRQQKIQFLGPSQKKPSTFFSTETKIFPEVRKNSLILLGTEKNLEKVIEFIQKFIDIPISAAESRIHIKDLKYAKAAALKTLIPAIIKPAEGAIKALQVGQYKYFEDVLVEADYFTAGSEKDKSLIGGGGGNRLIISCNKDDWKRLDKLIDKLDKPQPQVAFEVMIVDLEISQDSELQSQFRTKNAGIIGMGIEGQFRNADGSTGAVNLIDPNGTTGANISFGKVSSDPSEENPTSLWGTLKAILSKENFNIITQPFVVTNNHNQCVVDSEEEHWINGALDKTVGTNLARSQKSKKAITKVTLLPHVNLEGVVDLNVDISIQNFTTTEQTDPNTTERYLTTRVSMLAGEVLVLGGLTRTGVEEKLAKTPILGDIPIIGNFFRTRTKSNIKNNLYIFIRPSVIKPRFEGVPDEYTQLKMDYAKYQMLNADMYTKSKDPIQRWFFKPSDQSIKEKLKDARLGILRPIDDYTYGKEQPKEVDIKNDPYYNPSEALKKEPNKNSTFATNVQSAPATPPTKRKLKSRKDDA